MLKKYDCEYCNNKNVSENNMAYTRNNAGEGYNRCWACWKQEQRDREDAQALLD